MNIFPKQIPEQCSCHSIDHIAVTPRQYRGTDRFQFKAYNERQTQKSTGVSMKCQQTYNKFFMQAVIAMGENKFRFKLFW